MDTRRQMADVPDADPAPYQRVVPDFPRYGVLFWQRVPDVPEHPVIEIAAAGSAPIAVDVSRLAELPRRELVADFHCVCGWTAPELRWSGVSFRAFYETVILREVRPLDGVDHVIFSGSDGYRSVLTIADALGDDVLLADRLADLPLTGDHGAPVRLVSPLQYGYKSTKHLCAIDLVTGEPLSLYSAPIRIVLDTLLKPHPRARVWEEERHRYLPAWMVRAAYRAFVPLVRRVNQRRRMRWR